MKIRALVLFVIVSLIFCNVSFAWNITDRDGDVAEVSKAGGLQIDTQSGYQTLMYYDGSDQLEYVCVAAGGAATSSAVWRIYKMTYDGSGNITSIKFADGNANFDNVCDNRAALTYQ